jgi:DNA-binding CsgD family transcriptional regulator
VAKRVENMGQTGELQPTEYRIVLPDQAIRHVRAILVVAEVRGGTPYRMVGWVQDVTDRRQAERKLAAHVAVSEALAAWGTLETGAERLLAGLGEALGCFSGTLWVPEGDTLLARVLWHPRNGHDGSRGGAGLAGMAWERREPVTSAGLPGAVAIPALFGHDVLAVVELASHEGVQLTERLMRSLTGIGHELGQFLARHRGELDEPLLTAREREVLQLAAGGLSAPRIAGRLVISEGTVRTHFGNIYPKLGVSDRVAAVAQAIRLGLIH